MLIVSQDRNAPAAKTEPASADPETPGPKAKDFDNDQLQSFFTGLMNRNAE